MPCIRKQNNILQKEMWHALQKPVETDFRREGHLINNAYKDISCFLSDMRVISTYTCIVHRIDSCMYNEYQYRSRLSTSFI